MQEESIPGSVRHDLLDRLKALDMPIGSGSVGDLAYRRARDALEKALEEARTIRLQAIEDARATREREMIALVESLRALRLSTETEIALLLKEAEVEAERIRSRAAEESRAVVEQANEEAETTREESRAIRAAAEAKRREIEQLEADFNRVTASLAERMGVTEKPEQGWLLRLTGRR
jgi:hypothetical protein